MPRRPARVGVGEHVLPGGEIAFARGQAAQILGLDQPFAPRILAALAQPLVLDGGGDVEEELDDQRAMIALLGLELVDLVVGAGPVLGLAAAERAIVDDLAVPAAIEKRVQPAGGSVAQYRASQWRSASSPALPRTLWVAKCDGSHAAASRLQGGLLAGAFPAFEQDDGTLAMDDLRQLERRQPILQRAQRRSIVPREGISPFKFR